MRGAVPRTCVVRGLSGLGRTTLVAVIPILSSMGVQPVPLPAAALATQTVGTEGLPPAASRPAWAPCSTTGSCPAGRPSASTEAVLACWGAWQEDVETGMCRGREAPRQGASASGLALPMPSRRSAGPLFCARTRGRAGPWPAR